MSKRVLIIGAGGVGRVVTHKCAQVTEVFEAICLASRRREKCDVIAKELSVPIQTEQVDADQTSELVQLIERFQPDLVINVALPYQNLTIMDACLETGVHYVDTANYEPRDVAKFEYHWQWAYRDRFKERGITALLGSGFDPGVTNIFCAYAQKHLFTRIDEIDILDCNDGDHGHPFATNFNPEINIREVTANGRYWEQGEWQETPPLAKSLDFAFPEVGVRKAYLMYHEEIESLCQNIPNVQRIRFWMTFSEQYLTHLEVLGNVGLTRIDPVIFNGQPVIPLQFLKAILPDPGSLGSRTKGQTCIGCFIEGESQGAPKRVFIHNNCDHEACFQEVRSQAVSYTTGVPTMIGAKMILEDRWAQPGVFNIEKFDPDPFMADLNAYGLPWQVKDSGLEALPV
ncbi:MAG: Carboxynorspermidine synthase [Verrucomicrobia subdivision 3 bacterium]|nr:Carboxynorspermidine synthase [Limisphaerales bacterium]